MSGTDNPITDALSRVHVNTLSSQTPVVNFKAMVAAQQEDPEILYKSLEQMVPH